MSQKSIIVNSGGSSQPGLPVMKQSQVGAGVIVGAIVNKLTTMTATDAAPEARPITGASNNAGGSGDGLPLSILPAANQKTGITGIVNPMLGPLPGNTTKSVLARGGVGGAGGDLQPAAIAMACSADSTLANTKEKTPMCLINELARYNKIQHQYTLTDEQGPAHKKNFFVKLKLGEEEYSACGPSIKKAQHAAAGLALGATRYKHPAPKPHKFNDGMGNMVLAGNITPTVELNALAMKRGEPTVYRCIEPQRPNYYPPPNLDFRGMYNQRYHYPRMPRMYYVSLKVGQREFIGEGSNRQVARHNAANKALKALSMLPIPDNIPISPVEHLEKVLDVSDGFGSDDLKSEISLVYEIALKRNLPVNFTVVKESGPPHMRNFITKCIVGDYNSEGEGNGKKISKKRAASKMLGELKTLTPLPVTSIRSKPKTPAVKKKSRNLIKDQKTSPDYGTGINPISRLIQIQQAKKEREPMYSLIAEKGMPRRREFVMQVTVGDHVCQGIGPNKKLAKRTAAEAMLQLLGYSQPVPQPSKPSLKTSANGDTPSFDHKKVSFLDTDLHPADIDCKGGRQLVPGVLLMRGQPASNANVSPTTSSSTDSSSSKQTTSQIAKELLDKGSSPTAEALLKTGSKPMTSQKTVRPQQQLLYLADVLGFHVQFTDFPKGNNKNEFLSLVSLSTNPPHVSHGSGTTVDESHDTAALNALKTLAELGLSTVQDVHKLDKVVSATKVLLADSSQIKNEAAIKDSTVEDTDVSTTVTVTLKSEE